jgi:elongation factor G
MKEYSIDQIRNIALVGHGSAGKTSLAEAMLYNSGAIKRMGRVEDGNTVTDFDEEEIRRHISLVMGLAAIEWSGCKLNVLDVPGYTDFVGEVKSALRVADCALVVVDSVAGVEVGTELAWSYADELKLPRMVVVAKLDRDNANFPAVLDSLSKSFEGSFVPLQVPIGSQSDFEGVVDLVSMTARRGSKGEAGEIPEALEGQVAEFRLKLMEAAAEGDDELIMKYLDGQELTEEEIQRGLRLAIKNGTVIPVLCNAATANIGINLLMDTVEAFAPSPADRGVETATNPATGAEETLVLSEAEHGPLAAFVFKTMADPYVGKLTYFRVYSGVLASDSRVFNPVHNQEERIGQAYFMRGKEQIATDQVKTGDIGVVAKLSVTATGDTLCDRGHPLILPPATYPLPLISVAVEPKTKADSAKLGPTLTRLCDEDLTLRWHQEASTKQAILEGMGDSHLDVAIRRAASKFGVDILTSPPKVPYRETITRSALTQYRHKKQTGGAGQFAEVHMRVEPNERDAGYEFAWEVFGGAVSGSFQTSIEKGIKSVMESGVIAGYPVVDVKCAVTDGKEHPVDSKPIAFEIAGRGAFKQAFMDAGPVLLEPVMTMQVTIPDQYTGDVIGDLNTRRARVLGMDQVQARTIITATVPLAEVQRYAADLRSLTQGRGVFSMVLDHYETVPAHLAQEIIDKAKHERVGGEEE